MYPEIGTYLRCKDTSEMHAEYMRDTSICREELDTCGIHSRYIEDTYELHVIPIKASRDGTTRLVAKVDL